MSKYPYRNSTDVPWTVAGKTGQQFTFLGAVFSIAKAKLILAKTPHDIQGFDFSALCGWAGPHGLIRVDHTKLGDNIIMTIPVIVATVNSEPIVIDGWHRIAKQCRDGGEAFGVRLTEAETKKVRLW